MQREKICIGGMLLCVFSDSCHLFKDAHFFGNYAAIRRGLRPVQRPTFRILWIIGRNTASPMRVCPIESPSAILFDTRIDGRSITYDKWVPVTDMRDGREYNHKVA